MSEEPAPFARTGRIVFAVGFVSGIAQLAILRELAACHALSTLGLAIRLMVGVVLAAYGIGAALALRARKFEERRLLSMLGAGLSLYLLLLLIALLRWLEPGLSARAVDPLVLTGIALGVAPPFVVCGLVTALLTAKVQATTPERIGPLIALSLAGTLFGLAVSHLGASWAGINGLLLLAALAGWPALTDRKLPILATGLAIAALPVDNALESLRRAQPGFHPPVSAENTTHVYSGWSTHQKIDLYTFRDEVLLGFHDGFWQWWSASRTDHPHAFPGYDLLYDPDWIGGRDVLVIGSGAGMGLLHLEQAGPRSLTAVEIDPLVVALSRNGFSAYNDGIYERVPVHVVEGRAFLDSASRRFDAIVYEGSFLTSSHPRVAISAENHLYTREGLERALQRLRPDGVALVLFAGPEIALARVRAGARAAGAAVEGLRLRYRDTLWWDLPVLVFSHDPAVVGRTAAQIRRSAGPHARPLGLPSADPLPLRDRRPFLYASGTADLWPIASFAVAGLLAATVGIARPGRRRLRIYYVAIGAGFVLVQYGLLSHFRSFLGDPVTTAWSLWMLLLIGMGTGSACALRWLRARHWVRWLCACAALAIAAGVGGFLPFEWSQASFALRLAVIALAVLPLAGLLGLFFPLGLRGAPPAAAASAYGWDAVGAVLGFGSFHLLALPLGIPAVLAAGALLYVCAFGLLVRH